MARTALTITKLAPNNATAKPAGVAGAADGHFITGVESEELFILVTVATGTTVLTVKAGESPVAVESVQGDAALSLPVGTHLVGPLTSGRFQRNDGTIWLDYATPANFSAIAPIHLPRTA